MTDESWKDKWQDAVQAVGQDISDGTTRWAIDRVEAGILRRYIEPLEINTLIHTDEQAAIAASHGAVVAPATATLALSQPGMWWEPGAATLWRTAERNAQPARSPISNDDPAPAPHTKGFFVTDVEVDFLRPVELGERLGTRGRTLLSCVLKETSVGRGGFSTIAKEIVSDKGDVVARIRTTIFAYDPIPRDESNVEESVRGVPE